MLAGPDLRLSWRLRGRIWTEEAPRSWQKRSRKHSQSSRRQPIEIKDSVESVKLGRLRSSLTNVDP